MEAAPRRNIMLGQISGSHGNNARPNRKTAWQSIIWKMTRPADKSRQPTSSCSPRPLQRVVKMGIFILRREWRNRENHRVSQDEVITLSTKCDLGTAGERVRPAAGKEGEYLMQDPLATPNGNCCSPRTLSLVLFSFKTSGRGQQSNQWSH